MGMCLRMSLSSAVVYNSVLLLAVLGVPTAFVLLTLPFVAAVVVFTKRRAELRVLSWILDNSLVAEALVVVGTETVL